MAVRLVERYEVYCGYSWSVIMYAENVVVEFLVLLTSILYITAEGNSAGN